MLRRLLRGQRSPADAVLHLYVRCTHCGAAVHGRVHLVHDLTVEFGTREEVTGYYVHKELLDDRCYRLMYADLHFDRNRRELTRAIEGGAFIDQAEFERLSSAHSDCRKRGEEMHDCSDAGGGGR